MGLKIFKKCKECFEEEIQRRLMDRPYVRLLKPWKRPGISQSCSEGGLSNNVYTEPYRAIEKLSDVVFKIKRTAYRKVSREHVDRLKLDMLTKGEDYHIDMMHKQVMESDM